MPFRPLQETTKAVLTVTGHPTLLANNPNLKRLLEMREPYIEPLNILQVRAQRERWMKGRERQEGERGMRERERERTCCFPSVCVLFSLRFLLACNQVEIIRRLRLDPGNAKLKDAMLLSINGVAAGMRNTG